MEKLIDCQTGGCRCRRTLYSTEGFRGAVEVKCPRCRRIHHFGDMMTGPVREIRCPNSFKGLDAGGWCGQLIMKISGDSVGALAYRCPRCKHERTVRIEQPAMAST